MVIKKHLSSAIEMFEPLLQERKGDFLKLFKYFVKITKLLICRLYVVTH